MVTAGSLLSIAVIIGLPLALSLLYMGSFQSKAAPRMAKTDGNYPIYIEDSVMSPKAHGTCALPVMSNLRWGCDHSTADRICCFNRHYAEHSGYWKTTKFLKEVTTLLTPDRGKVI
jgi:hypothetical protein